MKHILIIVTNHATLGTTDQANGTYAPELTHALDVFNDAGMTYDIASINGGEAPLYGTDIEGDEINAKILADADFQEKMANTKAFTDVHPKQYNALFYPGGFGLLTDLSSHEGVAKIAAQIYEQGAIIGAVCHGPGCLLPITLSDGSKLIDDKEVTAFTREEEVDFGTINDIPFLLEEALARNAGSYSKTKPWQEYVVVDGRLITGQNPQSAHRVAQKMVEEIKPLLD